MADRRLLMQSVTLQPENFSGAMTIDARLAGPQRCAPAAGSRPPWPPAAQAFGVAPAGAQPVELPLTLEVELGRTYRLDRLVPSDDDLHGSRCGAMRAALATGVTALVARHHEAWRDGRPAGLRSRAIPPPSAPCALPPTIS